MADVGLPASSVLDRSRQKAAGHAVWLAIDGKTRRLSRIPRVRGVSSPRSLWSSGSLLSIASEGSILSIGSVGSVLSIGSIGSACSVLSIGSAGSAASVLSFASKRSLLSAGSVDSVHGAPMGPRQRRAVGIGLLALGAVLLRG